jgi:hypothetical protein
MGDQSKHIEAMKRLRSREPQSALQEVKLWPYPLARRVPTKIGSSIRQDFTFIYPRYSNILQAALREAAVADTSPTARLFVL